MNRSESIINLAKALLKAQKEMEFAKKDSNNPYFKSKYADYNSVLEAVKEPLNNNGILILQPHKIIENNQMIVETVLIHSESGEFISAETLVKSVKENDPQALFSAQTYARRYSLQSLVSLPSDNDDDGESAVGRGNIEPKGRLPIKETKVEVKPTEVKAEEPPVRRRVAVATTETKPDVKTEVKKEVKQIKETDDQW